MLNQVKEWQPVIDRYRGTGLRGVIWMGAADDTIPRDNVRQLAEMLNTAGIPTRLETFEGLGHAYPPDFEQVADHALEFIFQPE